MKDTISALEIALRETPQDGPPKDGEMTINQYMEAINERKKESDPEGYEPMGRQFAYRALEKLVELGKLQCREGIFKGKRQKIYGPPQK